MGNRSCSAHWTLPGTAALHPIKHSNDSLLSPRRLEIYFTGTCTSPSHDELCCLYIPLIPDFAGDSFSCVNQAVSGEHGACVEMTVWQSFLTLSLIFYLPLFFLPFIYCIFWIPIRTFSLRYPQIWAALSEGWPDSGHAELHISGLYASAAGESLVWRKDMENGLTWENRGRSNKVNGPKEVLAAAAWAGEVGRKYAVLEGMDLLGDKCKQVANVRNPDTFPLYLYEPLICVTTRMLTGKIRGIL